MNCNNNANRMRKRVLIEIARLALKRKLVEEIDRLPLALHPRGKQGVRCCVYKDRAVARYRIMATLGHRVEGELNELKPLSAYATEALERTKIEGPPLTLIDDACSACMKGRHFVTNVCRGCVARPCSVNCPKNAIQIVNGQACIDEERCVNCGLCKKVCPYHAIAYVPVPCEEVCPVKAISKNEQGTETVDYGKCISCGKCLASCPFGAMMERSQIVDVIALLINEQSRPLVAMTAPAVGAQFPNSYAQVKAAVKTLGFAAVADVAEGAAQTAEREALEWEQRVVGEGRRLMTTSCCPAYVLMTHKHLPELAPFVSHTPSPMHMTAETIKKRMPEAITVFIGPCTAKRSEAYEDPAVDYVLTTEELGAMFVAADIEIEHCALEADSISREQTAARFAFSGGVSACVKERLQTPDMLKAELIDGLDRKSTALLKAYAKGKGGANFIEIMSCAGGCVGGPVTLETVAKARKRIEKLIDQSGDGALQ
ncbi:MAG: 4Fe-4S dicluster domain-containing protein [Chitinivibrionales bacterium]|nr:4Fe-4S dicluster domain-containing protein [Chitinivibrionales bacterium]MBD3356995.1 4Fe-4S dicluster domain-containing protein [Chitinivibrionales bacterium]